MICNLCPRKCGVDRYKQFGFCGETESAKVALTMLHHFEEPVISGTNPATGSGAVFFSGCNMHCVFCQNHVISARHKGEEISVDALAEKFKELEKAGALNINLVSPTHFCNQIKQALDIYKPNIPIVWNSNGYETVEMLEGLKGYVDIFLVDLKYADNSLAMKYSSAPNYFEFASSAILAMKKFQPHDVIENGLMKRGVIIRHLVLPNHVENSLECLDFVANNIGKESIVSIMSQYEPMHLAKNFEDINRKLKPIEYKRVVNYALKLGLTNAYTQELSSANSIYTPNF